MVLQSFKSQFYKNVLISNRWRKNQYLPNSVQPIRFAFPPIVSEKKKRLFAHQALENIYKSHPILRRVESGLPGLPYRQMDQFLFEAEFLGKNRSHEQAQESYEKSKKRIAVLFSNISIRINEIYESLIVDQSLEIRQKVLDSLPPKGDYYFMNYNQRVFLLAWEYFLEKEFDNYIAVQMAKVYQHRADWKIPSVSLNAIDKVYSNWIKEINWTTETICKMETDTLQELPGLPALHFSKLTTSDTLEKDTIRELAGYCSAPWKSKKTRLEDVIKVLALPSMAIAMFLPGGASLGGVYAVSSALIASASFGIDAISGTQKNKIKSAILNLGVSERLQSNFKNIYNAAMSAIVFHFSGKLVLGARSAIKVRFLLLVYQSIHCPACTWSKKLGRSSKGCPISWSSENSTSFYHGAAGCICHESGVRINSPDRFHSSLGMLWYKYFRSKIAIYCSLKKVGFRI